MSRTRLIRPQFFADERIADLSIASRFVYIGLWTLCDDAGYFEMKPRQIAASLFPYDGPARRQRVVDEAIGDLAELDRVTLLDCGQHGIVPTLPRHGAKGGNTAFTFKEQHEQEASDTRVRPTPSPVRTKRRRVRTPSTDKSSSESVLGSVLESVSSSVSHPSHAPAHEAEPEPDELPFGPTTTTADEGQKKNGAEKPDAYAGAHGLTRAGELLPKVARR